MEYVNYISIKLKIFLIIFEILPKMEEGREWQMWIKNN